MIENKPSNMSSPCEILRDDVEAELDFIINYDIKYRMGGEEADDGE
ncbi:MAG: hypothetical protein J5I93_22415 [Pirellulaceae bacterium]|nr:hypothetical protein [Pirellulaceae bacterium]